MYSLNLEGLMEKNQFETSHVKQTVLIVVIPGLTLFATAANVMLLLVLLKFTHLSQSVNRIIRQVIAIEDILLCNLYCALNMLVLYFDQEIPMLICQSLSICSATVFRCRFLAICIMALERYVFVAHPLKYIHLVTKGKTQLGIVASVLLPLIFTFVTELLCDRELNTESLSCVFKQPEVTIAQSIIFVIPSFLFTMAISMNVWSLAKKRQNQPESGMSQTQIKKSFRLIAFISGTFWITFIPPQIVMFVSAAASMYFKYSNLTMMLLINASCLSVTVYGSPTFSPVLQFYLDNDLWIGLKRLFGMKLLFRQQQEVIEAIGR